MTVIPNGEKGSIVVDCKQTSSGKCVVAIVAPGESRPRIVSAPVNSKRAFEAVPTGSEYCVGIAEDISWESCPKSVLQTVPTNHSYFFVDANK